MVSEFVVCFCCREKVEAASAGQWNDVPVCLRCLDEYKSKWNRDSEIEERFVKGGLSIQTQPDHFRLHERPSKYVYAHETRSWKGWNKPVKEKPHEG